MTEAIGFACFFGGIGLLAALFSWGIEGQAKRRRIARKAAAVVLWLAFISTLPRHHTLWVHWLNYCGYEDSSEYCAGVVVVSIFVFLWLGPTWWLIENGDGKQERPRDHNREMSQQ